LHERSDFWKVYLTGYLQPIISIGFEVDIASLWEAKIPFLVALSFLIYACSVELLSIKRIEYCFELK